MTDTKAPRWSRVATAMALACLAGCGMTNQIYPLRGEDPQALALSGDRQDFLTKTAASRTVEAFRKAARDGDWKEAARLLAPTTRATLQRRADETRMDAARVLAQGKVPGLELAGVDDPVKALAADGKFFAGEDAPFDPTRRRATVTVRTESQAPFQVPVVFTEDGWRLELMRSLDIPTSHPGS